MEQIENVNKRTRSPEYPGYSFEECIEFVKIIDGLGNGPVAYSLISSQLGLTSITTKSFTNKISSSKQFGLITVSNKTAELTSEAKLLLYPTENNVAEIKVECVKRPNLYSSLIQKFENKALPSKDVIANILLNEFKLLKTIKDSVAEKFIDSVTQVGLVKNGVLVSNNTSESTTKEESLNENKDTKLEIPSEYRELNIRVDSGKEAKLSVPKDCSQEEIEMIKDMIDLFFKRRFNI